MHIPRLLARFVGEDYLKDKLRQIEAGHAAARDRIHAVALGKACLMHPDEDPRKLSMVITAIEDEVLTDFEDDYRKKCKTLRAAIAACQ